MQVRGAAGPHSCAPRRGTRAPGMRRRGAPASPAAGTCTITVLSSTYMLPYIFVLQRMHTGVTGGSPGLACSRCPAQPWRSETAELRRMQCGSRRRQRRGGHRHQQQWPANGRSELPGHATLLPLGTQPCSADPRALSGVVSRCVTQVLHCMASPRVPAETNS